MGEKIFKKIKNMLNVSNLDIIVIWFVIMDFEVREIYEVLIIFLEILFWEIFVEIK